MAATLYAGQQEAPHFLSPFGAIPLIKKILRPVLLALSLLAASGTTYSLSAAFAPTPAQAGKATKVIAGAVAGKVAKDAAKKAIQKKVAKETAKAAAKKGADKKAASKLKRDFAAEMIEPKPVDKGFDAITKKQMDQIKAKIDQRTATRAEVKQLESNNRFANRRDRGVNRQKAEEKALLKSGQSGTRNWSEDQKADILKNKTPKFDGKPMEGHHKYSAESYPHLSDNPKNVTPVTKDEHFYKWHDGNWQNQTHGKPLNPDFKDQF